MEPCRKCGLPLTFVKRRGKDGAMKWFPVNPDGSDHWDTCTAERRSKIPLAVLMKGHKPLRSASTITYVWIGKEPPWEQGEYRDFTDEEKVERQICAPYIEK